MLSKITITNKNGFDEIHITENGKTSNLKRDLNGDYAAQRNYALEKAKGDWVFFIDTDESIEDDFDHIPSGYEAFKFKRLDNFFGKTLHHGEAGNIKLVRLAKKDFGKWIGKVHEVWVGNGKVGTWPKPIIHTPHPTISEFIKEINAYTTIYAKDNKNFSYFDLVKPQGKFIYNYFFKLGFLDGLAGFVMAYMMSLHSLIARVKQYEQIRTH